MLNSRRKNLKQRRIKSNSLRRSLWESYVVRFLKFFLFFGFIIPILVGVYVVYDFIASSNLLKITEINVKGASRIESSVIEDIVYSQRKKRIYQININKIAKDIKGLPGVEHVVVRRDLPNRISIDIKERKPFAVLNYRNRFYEMDINGILISKSKIKETKNIPIIYGIRRINSDVALGYVPNSIKFKTALKILKEALVSDISIYFSVIKINVRNLRQIILYTDKGVEIHLGNDKIKTKLNKLAILLAERKKEVMDARYIDLRFNSINIKPGRY